MIKKQKKPHSGIKIRVISDSGQLISTCNHSVAKHSVHTGRSKWIDKATIMMTYSNRDIKQFKKYVHDRDKCKCFYCGEKMHLEHPLLTIDHLVPISLRGSVLPHNMVSSCKTCNEQKASRTYPEYFLHVYAVLWFRLNSKG